MSSELPTPTPGPAPDPLAPVAAPEAASPDAVTPDEAGHASPGSAPEAVAEDQPSAPVEGAAIEGATIESALTAPDEASPESTPAPAAQAARVNLEVVSAALKQHFPALFAGQPKPIKLRIHTDIQQRTPGVFTRQALSAFLRRHTGSTSYLIALEKATHRLDLDGQPAGEVSPEHHAAAVEELARRRALRRERAQAQRPAQRAPHALREAGAQPAAAHADAEAGAAPVTPRPGGDDASQALRPERTERPARPPRPGRRDRSDSPGRQGRSDRPPRRPEKSPQQDRPAAQHPQRPRPQRQAHAPQPPSAAAATPLSPVPPRSAPAAPTAEDLARRERMQLLRAFDSSPLTKANFCALKGMKVDHLDAQLTLARQEAAAWAAAHPPVDRGPDRHPDRGQDRRPERSSQGHSSQGRNDQRREHGPDKRGGR